jgi:flagellar FliL protein
MAEEKEDKEKKEGEGAGKKSKKKLIIIIAVVLVVLIGGGVGAFLALGSKPKEGAEGEDGGEGEEETETEEAADGALPGAVVPLDPFIVNLLIKGSFLKTTIQLEFSEPEAPHSFEASIPKVRDAIIRILSSKEAKEILSAEGKEKLRGEVREGVNKTLESEDVVQVYFTEFIIQ